MNNVNLIGRLTKDIEIRKTQSNLSVATFTVAVNSTRKDNEGNYIADFIPCTAWRQTAEFMAKYLHKGSLISVEGSLQTSTYPLDGRNVFKMEVTANNVQSLESKKKEEQPTFTQESPVKEKTVEFDTDALPFY